MDKNSWQEGGRWHKTVGSFTVTAFELQDGHYGYSIEFLGGSGMSTSGQAGKSKEWAEAALRKILEDALNELDALPAQEE